MSVTLITASAGTGKTHRLVDEIERALVDADAPLAPEHLVAVTYTRKAAAELDERLRRRLIGAGRVDLARRLGAARIGTVHAVCQRLVDDYAFELGLSPELRTLDERLAEHVLSDVLSSLLSDDEISAVDDLARRMDAMRGFPYRVKELVDFARAHGLSAFDLRDGARRSRARLLDLLPGPVGDADEIEGALLAGVDKYLARAQPTSEDGRLNWDFRAATEVRHALTHGNDVPWFRWLSLSKALGPAATGHVFHPQLREDLLKSHDLVFDVAARGLEHYATSKRAWGVVDFVDQELHALTLLRRDDLRARLTDEIRFVLVDEVQDTSPQQLEIFRALAHIAERSVWVGDRKQSIYGFRGADPTILDDAIEDGVTSLPPPLSVSRRSRRPLVALTSAVFSRAFERHDAASGDATLHSVFDDDDEALGPFLEWWDPTQLRGEGARADRDRGGDKSLARGVLALLGSEPASVRDRLTGAVRPATAGDIAILVRKNSSARRIAEALGAVGVRAVLRREGLGRTLEARLLRAALCLWVDGGDRLAAAELARVLDDAPPELFMARLADTGGAIDGFAARVRDAAALHRGAGVVVAVDQVVDALGLLGWCAQVDDGAQRRANLAALRALAVRTVEAAHAQGRGATVVGFIARLDELAEHHAGSDDDDRIGLVEDGDAVHIVTWHAAKGLEWPIVVLAELDHRPPRSVFGLHAERDGAGGRRWPRCWVSPYRFNQGHLQFGLHAHMKESPEAQRLAVRAQAEELRLLYVAWTRARDRLVLAGTEWELERGPLTLLEVPSLSRRTRWAGVEVACAVRRLVDEPLAPPPLPVRDDYVQNPPCANTSAFIQPSGVERDGAVAEEVQLGAPLSVLRFPDDDEATRLGSALHAVFAVWHWWPQAERTSLIVDVLERHQVTGILPVADVQAAAERLFAFTASRFTDAAVSTEVPVTHRLPSGAQVRGQIDLLATSDADLAIIDHKTYVADAVFSREKAGTFAGQLGAYGDAVAAATGRAVGSLWIHMPVAGRMFRIEG